MEVGEIFLTISAYAMFIGLLGFLRTLLTRQSRRRESDWLHEIGKGLSEEEVMKPAQIRDNFHKFYKVLITLGLVCLVLGLIFNFIER